MPPGAASPDAMAALHAFGIDVAPLPFGPFPMWLVAKRRPLAPAVLDLLSNAERDRAARFRTTALRDRYLAAHAGLRLLSESCFGVAAACQRYEIDALGKPRLADDPDARCNMSYSRNCALIGLSRGAEIGVDIEAIRAIDDAPELMELHYTPREKSALHRMRRSGAGFDRGFLTVWVRKEACVKALGCGLSMPLTDLECGMDERMTTVGAGSDRLRTGVIQASCDHVIAWASRC